jgi:hypothetical protein
MTSRRGLAAFVEALVNERRPKGFGASPEDARLVSTAITLRAGRPGEGGPHEEFVADLHRQLVEQDRELSTMEAAGSLLVTQASAGRGRRRIPPLRGLAAVAAATVALVGGTVMVTNAVDHPSRTTSPQAALGPSSLRFATLHGVGGSLVGEVYVHQGSPSWMFMSLHGARSSGTVMCELRLADGATVPVGPAQVKNGTAQLARSVNVDVSQLRGAKLVAPGGSTLASASFS